MDREMFIRIEQYMKDLMKDGAHDCQHIYRVLYYALDISTGYKVDKEVLIAAALLHDIGREAQYKDPKCDHAIVGAEMAYKFLCSLGWREEEARHVKACISTHRYRNDSPPESIEAKILFDSDKLDVTGAIGIARTLAYGGIIAQPMYSVDAAGQVLRGEGNEEPSFFHEYHLKIKGIYDKFFTERAKIIAEGRRQATIDFYESMYTEVAATHEKGFKMLYSQLV